MATRRRPRTAHNSSSVGGLDANGKKLPKPSRTHGLNAASQPRRPLPEKASCQSRDWMTSCTACCNTLTHATPGRRPSAVAHRISCWATTILRFNKPKTCVSSGCNSHVSEAGTKTSCMRILLACARTRLDACCAAASKYTTMGRPGKFATKGRLMLVNILQKLCVFVQPQVPCIHSKGGRSSRRQSLVAASREASLVNKICLQCGCSTGSSATTATMVQLPRASLDEKRSWPTAPGSEPRFNT